MSDDFWVFAYGSLMWRPGFEHIEARAALLRGYHRDMCVVSTIYRGTPECPGLVMGLDRGGACRGRAFRVASENEAAVRAYLDDREMVTMVYTPRMLPVTLEDGRRIPAWCFVVRRDHPQYAGRLPPAEAARLIRQGVGRAGCAREYLALTVAHLEDMGILDGALHRLLDLVDGGG
ncbi:MAG: gamma-glutamylcyclotransferase [Alphaproteobacteria bacterium]|nr:gamma-glutamylcyclotransferase [Alphaproteobacteria bacterium]